MPHPDIKREILDKSISFRSYIAIGLGAIIGIGWVIYAGYWLRDGGPVGAMLAFILCGLFLLPVGKCYAELTAAIPVAGGEAAFTYKAFGPFVSFLTASALALSYIAITPFETIAIGALVEAMFPALISEPLYQVGGYTVRVSNLLPGIVLGAFLILLNCRGARSSTGFQTLVLAALALCALVFISVALVKGDVANLTPMFSTGGALWIAAPASIIPVLVVAPYFMAGFDAIPQAAEEAGVAMTPHRIGIAILLCIVLGAVFYALIILALGMSSTPGQLETILQDRDTMPTAEIFRLAFGYEWAAQLVLFAALLGLLTTLNGFYIASSRLLFALGRGGMLPHWFAKVDVRHGTPRQCHPVCWGNLAYRAPDRQGRPGPDSHQRLAGIRRGVVDDLPGCPAPAHNSSGHGSSLPDRQADHVLRDRRFGHTGAVDGSSRQSGPVAAAGVRHYRRLDVPGRCRILPAPVRQGHGHGTADLPDTG